VPSLSLLAFVLRDLHQTGEAISLLEKAVEIEPSWVLLHAVLDHVYTWIGERGSAIESAQRALRLAEQFHAVSTAATYSYYESAVTGRWVNDQDMDELKRRAARTP
jgi:tetratricopeptide (TPR) repeat protein